MFGGVFGGPKKRYLGGLRPKKYFEQEILPTMGDIFTILDIDIDHQFSFFQLFMDIDKGADGSIDLDEFYSYFQIKRTKFSDRVFAVIDVDDKGELGFKEFAVGVWNYCTYDDRHLCRFAFDLFDIDKGGKLDYDEVDALVRMLFNVEDADPNIITYIKDHDNDSDNEIDLDEFVQVVRAHPEVMYPAFHIQEQVRSGIFGVKYWMNATVHRDETFGVKERELAEKSGSDHIESGALWKAVLTEKQHKRRAEMKQAEIEAIAEKKRQEILAKQREEAEREKERQDKFDSIAVLKSAQTKGDRDEARGWRDYEGALEHLREMAQSQEFDKIRKARQRMWVSLEDAILRREKNWASKEAAARANKEIIARQRMNIYERSHEGIARIQYDMRRDLSKHRWCRCSCFYTPMLAWICQSRAAKIHLEEKIKEECKHEIVADHDEEISREYNARRKARAADNKMRILKTIREFGTSRQYWDKVWSDDSQRFYYYNYRTKRTQWDRPHVCENCNFTMEAGDIKCFECNAERSILNQELYENGQPKDLTGGHYHSSSAAMIENLD